MERVQGRALYVKEIIAYLGYYGTGVLCATDYQRNGQSCVFLLESQPLRQVNIDRNRRCHLYLSELL
jgi:hypothetical protein